MKIILGFVFTILWIIQLQAQYWDGAPGQQVNFGLDIQSETHPLVGQGEYLYCINYSSDAGHTMSVLRWSACAGWQNIGNFGAWDNPNGEFILCSLAISGNYLYVGGGFDEISSLDVNGDPVCVAATNIARFNLNTSQWSGIGYTELDRWVEAVTVDNFGNVYAGTKTPLPAGFTSDLDSEMLMKWDGSNWSGVGDGLYGFDLSEMENGVYALATDGTNVFASGQFSGASGVPACCLIKWNGGAWTAMAGLYYDDSALWAGPSSGGKDSIIVAGTNVFIAGGFDSISTNGTDFMPAAGIARVSSITGLPLPCPGLALTNVSFGNLQNGIGDSLVQQNGSVYLTGRFDLIGTIAARNIATWNITSDSWSALGPGLSISADSVYPYACGFGITANTNAVFVYGFFDYAGDVAITSPTSIARWMTAPDAACPATIETVAGEYSLGGTYTTDSNPVIDAGLYEPTDIVFDNTVDWLNGNENYYICDQMNYVVDLVETNSNFYTVAGNDSLGSGYSGDGGGAGAATLSLPAGLASDASGNVFIADQGNNVIRKVDHSGIITTVAGNYSAGGAYAGDGGAATNASLNNPNSVAVDNVGNLYIADLSNNLIRKVDTNGIITTVAGKYSLGGTYSGDGGAATNAGLNYPSYVRLDSVGNIYICDALNNVIRKVDTTGIITTVAGNHTLGGGYSGDGGAATNACLSFPMGLAISSSLYISDSGNNVIRAVSPRGVISTVAGSVSLGGTYSGDGGPATSAGLNFPCGLALDGYGTLYISDSGNNVIRTATPLF